MVFVFFLSIGSLDCALKVVVLLTRDTGNCRFVLIKEHIYVAGAGFLQQIALCSQSNK